jgi:ankyrin repeat protein
MPSKYFWAAVTGLIFGTKVDDTSPSCCDHRISRIVTLLIEAKASSFDVKDSHGRTPLFWAAQKNHLSVAKALLQAGADPNATEDGATSPFLLGDLLLPIIPDSPVSRDCEALINCTRPGGQTPLFFAAGKGYHNMTKATARSRSRSKHSRQIRGDCAVLGCREKM